MYYVYLVLTGIVSGILGGMGMGGGTLLIPLLTLIFNFNQKLAQGINLISFSIMALIIIFVHIKNKLINVKVAIQFFCFAATTSALGAYLASIINTSILKVCFGILLILIALYQAIMFFVKK